MILIILLIFCVVITYTHPWIDIFTDYRGIQHIIFWYTNFKGERKFINLLGSQE